jgi:hypothetical protein
MDLILRPHPTPDPRHTYGRHQVGRHIIDRMGDLQKYPSYIDLSGSELKMVDVLALLLHQLSQTSDPDNPNYFTGNGANSLIHQYGSGYSSVSPSLTLSLYRVAKGFYNENVTGKHIENAKIILKKLSEKDFYLRYVEKSKKEENVVEDYAPLLKVKSLSQNSNEITLILHPIFRSQINRKWISCPVELLSQTVAANGGHKIKKSLMMLRNFLLRAMSSKRKVFEIRQARLLNIVAGHHRAQSRIKKAEEELGEGIEILRKLGFVKSVRETETTEKEKKLVFILPEKNHGEIT